MVIFEIGFDLERAFILLFTPSLLLATVSVFAWVFAQLTLSPCKMKRCIVTAILAIAICISKL